jgi:hypothetical protein
MGFIDKTGKVVISPQYDWVPGEIGFHEGLACVSIDKAWGFIDKQGNFVINPQYEYALPYHNGIAVVVVKYNKDCLIDKQGNVVYAEPF